MSKNHMSSGRWWYGLAFVMAFLASPWAWAGLAAAPGVGGGPDKPNTDQSPNFHGGLHTDPAFDGGWTVGSPTNRITITADPTAPNWIKVLQTPDPPFPVSLDTSFNVGEFLHVGPGPAWTDWHERILTPGWGWIGGILTAEDGQIVGGILTDTNLDGLFEAIDFFFDSLAPGNDVTIQKTIRCVELKFCDGQTVPGHGVGILIREFPTVVPEPGTLLLLAGGLAGLAALRRRRY